MKIFKQTLLAILAFASLFGCGPGRTIDVTTRDELDPDTAAEVRRINLERYSGDWLIARESGSLYLSIGEEGFYWVQEQNDGSISAADMGRIEHHLPGKMILRSNRIECESSRIGSWLWMDRLGDTVRLRSSEDENFTAELRATERRLRINELPCGPLN